ncbi:RagB/SusD family nutrient uptake outer membrane protein [Chitinophaga sp.]|uniref:RagB/SusD family nutrient uptake outer membrane protein n=1 Tax=Chitinophaga sp. TaxID=1869181 RepID=UPI002605983B|nr:RagB/SusD family nutrient uptake outer membrane protein [uncultured Chitinophaga sp.]
MKKLLIICLYALGMVSCRKFLEEYSETDLTPRRTADFGEILFADGYPDNQSVIHPWLVFLDDDSQCYVGPSVSSSLQSILSVRNIYQWQPAFGTQTGVSGFTMNVNAWAVYYKLILGTNVVLQHLDASIGGQAEKDQIKGEAYALRAWYHFMLVNLYARPYNDSTAAPDQSPGVPIRITADLTDDYMQRNTVQEVYARITRDLDSAILYLGKSRQRNNVFRISDLAAHLLASRVYLYMEDWNNCIRHADAVLREHPQLMQYAQWGSEPPTKDKMLIGPDNVESIWCYGKITEHFPPGYGYTFELSHGLVNSFEAEDLRKKVGIVVIPPFLKPYVAVEYQQLKVLGDVANAGLQPSNSWRSAEAYLNRAEAYIQLYAKGDASAAAQALKSLNTLRETRIGNSAYQPWTTMPANVLLDKCREERRRELYLEGHRWFDLRRYGMPTIRHEYTPDLSTVEYYTLRKRDPQYVIPIPEEVHQRNPALQRNNAMSGLRQPD